MVTEESFQASRKRKLENQNDKHPENDTIMMTQESIPKALQKYWRYRYNLFYKYDSGIRLTRELWYSVTPETIAIYLAKFIRHCYPDTKTVLDLFCGGGGNSVQLLKFFNGVVCIDSNQINLDCTLNNIGVYFGDTINVIKDEDHHGKVGDDFEKKKMKKWVRMIQCDWKYSTELNMDENPVEYSKTENVMNSLCPEGDYPVDVVFGSPPWGGPNYTKRDLFDLYELLPLGLDQLLVGLKRISDKIVLFLPRNSDLKQLQSISEDVFGKGVKIRVTNVYFNGGLKGILCFWGEEFHNYQREDQ